MYTVVNPLQFPLQSEKDRASGEIGGVGDVGRGGLDTKRRNLGWETNSEDTKTMSWVDPLYDQTYGAK